MRKGWFNESRRHSLARKGIKTAQKLGKVGTLAQGKTYLHWDDLPKHEKDHFIVVMGINNEEKFEKYLKGFGMKQRQSSIQIPKLKGWKDVSKTFSDGSKARKWRTKNKELEIHDENWIGSGWIVSVTSLKKGELPQFMSDTNNTKKQAYEKAIKYMQENKS